MNDPKLANAWRASKVRRCLRKKERHELVRFLRERHYERFFEPVQCLRKAPSNEHGYGFAIMALCSLLIETIQSYKDGLPTTNPSELDRLRTLRKVPKPYRIPQRLRVNGKKAFQRFFRNYWQHFPGLSGARFYKNVRNGLLHQGQTKSGWLLRRRGSTICDPKTRIVYRENFARELETCFESYMGDLRAHSWKHPTWKNAVRKLWWLIRLSI
ncbi:MAG: hypothetical protein ACREQA_04280 [Candidatus Binatia bacterium]